MVREVTLRCSNCNCGVKVEERKIEFSKNDEVTFYRCQKWKGGTLKISES